jgi:nucleotide-binding universal stress UspA family protein/GNAT superfamily N-acetyltransferase
MTMPEPDAFTTILVGLDGSDESCRAARLAASLANATGADLVAVHAAGLLDVWPDDPDHRLRNTHSRVRALFEGDWSAPIRKVGITAQYVLRDGPPVDVLLAVADEVNASVIVVGSRGSSASTLSTLGSTAATLVSRSARPVLVTPAGWPGTLFADVAHDSLLTTGRTVRIAPAELTDLGRVRAFYESLGDTSTYFRFFGIRRAIPDSELRNAVDPDVREHVTLLASIDDELVGIGEFIVTPAGDDAEMAFAVADDHHHEGIATLLLEALATVGRRCGLRRLTAKTLPGNADMLLVFRTVGLRHHTELDDDGVMTVTLDLSTIDELQTQSTKRHLHALASSTHLQP